MLEFLSEPARRAVATAQVEAERANHDCIGTEHLLIGAVENSDVAQRVLLGLGVDARQLRMRIALLNPPKEGGGIARKLSLSPRAIRAMEYAIEGARRLHRSAAGPEDLIIGLLREEHGLAFQAIAESGIDPLRLRRSLEHGDIDHDIYLAAAAEGNIQALAFALPHVTDAAIASEVRTTFSLLNLTREAIASDPASAGRTVDSCIAAVKKLRRLCAAQSSGATEVSICGVERVAFAIPYLSDARVGALISQIATLQNEVNRNCNLGNYMEAARLRDLRESQEQELRKLCDAIGTTRP